MDKRFKLCNSIYNAYWRLSFFIVQLLIHHFGSLYILWSRRGRLNVQYSMSSQVY